MYKRQANSLEWFKPKDDILLPYESANTDAGGSWYLVYKMCIRDRSSDGRGSIPLTRANGGIRGSIAQRSRAQVL